MREGAGAVPRMSRPRGPVGAAADGEIVAEAELGGRIVAVLLGESEGAHADAASDIRLVVEGCRLQQRSACAGLP